nr:hypothetical protein [Bacillus xiamenensis]
MKRSILFPRSHCEICKQSLSFHDMLPHCIERVL